jgi:Rod binding domain-containing protein
VPKIPTDSLAIQTGGAAAAQARADVERVKSLKERGTHSPKEIDKAAEGFEALLLHQMMKSMWEDSNQAQIVRDMFNQSVADEIAKGHGIGVKDVVKKEILRREKAS